MKNKYFYNTLSANEKEHYSLNFLFAKLYRKKENKVEIEISPVAKLYSLKYNNMDFYTGSYHKVISTII